MLKLIESNFEISKTDSNVDLDTNKSSNIVTLATGVLEIGTILSLQQVSIMAIKVIKGAFNSMIAALKRFFIPNYLKVAIVTTAIVAITTVVIINWNKIQPVFRQIANVFVGNAKKLGNTVSKVFDLIYQTASKSTSKDVTDNATLQNQM